MTLSTLTTDPLARRIRAARALAGLDQEQLATAIGTTRNSISNWETARSEPSATNFILLARACGVDLEWLADGVGVSGRSGASTIASFVGESKLRPRDYKATITVLSDWVKSKAA